MVPSRGRVAVLRFWSFLSNCFPFPIFLVMPTNYLGTTYCFFFFFFMLGNVSSFGACSSLGGASFLSIWRFGEGDQDSCEFRANRLANGISYWYIILRTYLIHHIDVSNMMDIFLGLSIGALKRLLYVHRWRRGFLNYISFLLKLKFLFCIGFHVKKIGFLSKIS